MNSLGRSARGAIILLLALVVGVWVISRVKAEPNVVGATVDGAVTTSLAVTESTTTTTLVPARDPKSVKVMMVNGTLTTGIAKIASKCLVAKYDVVPAKNAKTKPLAASVLYAGPTASAEAADIAATLGYKGVAVQFPVDPGVKDFPKVAPDVMFIIGDDMASDIRNSKCAQTP
jgi:LytR cell envelope-related transcriptional attenuator